MPVTQKVWMETKLWCAALLWMLDAGIDGVVWLLRRRLGLVRAMPTSRSISERTVFIGLTTNEARQSARCPADLSLIVSAAFNHAFAHNAHIKLPQGAQDQRRMRGWLYMTSRSQRLKYLADKIITSSTPSRLGRSDMVSSSML
jgi:hypothetical protein